MQHFVYIIYSPSKKIFYKGYTLNPNNRLLQHNAGESRYTQRCDDWCLVYVGEFSTKREALIEERRLKRLNASAIVYISFTSFLSTLTLRLILINNFASQC